LTTQHACPICGRHPMKLAFSEVVIGKHKADYFTCENCGLIQAEKPYWLKEAYHHPIAHSDTGAAMRCVRHQKKLEPILYRLFRGRGKFLDIGGGYGLLTRLLRDIGFDCYSTDKYCKNIFAIGFEPSEIIHADAVFAFEVLEHIEDPLGFLRAAMQTYTCNTVLFSTLVYSGAVPPKDWWYYSFHTGQHITFYQAKTLSLLAQKLCAHYYMLNQGFHMISRRPIRPFDRYIFSNRYALALYSVVVRLIRRRCSFTLEDQKLLAALPTRDD
jgi:2-polyprenyl-3-methyl-5-hydroxy-6-metoxy-1,4-benzoquinol methylase